MNALPTAGAAEHWSATAAAGPGGMAPPTPVVEVRIDRKAFADPATGRERLILDHVAFALRPAEFVALVGPSGCGKSTLLQIVAGLDPAFAGAIHWPGTSDGRHPSLGYCFQNPRLLPWLSLRANIDLVLDDPVAQAPRVDGLLRTMGLTEVGHFPANRLSVGMQRRAALARAFAPAPRLLLMDEPFVSLDAPTATQLRGLLLDLCEAQRPTVIFVTHDLHEATLLADRVLFLCAPPARVIGTAQVGIPRERRRDQALVDARFVELKRFFQSLYGPLKQA
ncbi:MAG TPA: ABC transporter ATP-binding protein [Lamprocystis sp. (in: g-proteobacteria)]|nr:ABC transporter ATP-binding protein [Lamprocystis sp. (in: g-proteobacteria)]